MYILSHITLPDLGLTDDHRKLFLAIGFKLLLPERIKQPAQPCDRRTHHHCGGRYTFVIDIAD